jgi:guanylate kinase
LASSTGRPVPVFVITGQSGAGKGTLIRQLLERFPQLELAVSATTRARRPGEEEGREYWFQSADEFERRVVDDEFLEWVEYVGNRYGTLRSEVERISTRDRVPVLELETEGALRVKHEDPRATTIFVTAPLPELERRLRERATESSGEIEERLRVAKDQLTERDAFDVVVENDRLEDAVSELVALVQRELDAAATMQS